jgi:hypothetical protein
LREVLAAVRRRVAVALAWTSSTCRRAAGAGAVTAAGVGVGSRVAVSVGAILDFGLLCNSGFGADTGFGFPIMMLTTIGPPGDVTFTFLPRCSTTCVCTLTLVLV